MVKDSTPFSALLSKIKTKSIPLYCTGYPDPTFISQYCDSYHIPSNNDDFVINDKNYSIIRQMGFDAISIWDFRRGNGGYILDQGRHVDGWGRIYKENWYTWDGVFKTREIMKNWTYLTIPSERDLKVLKIAMDQFKKTDLEPVFSLPGLFEKTWQAMGFLFFSKCLRQQNFSFIERVIDFFFNYTVDLIRKLRQHRACIFLVADDMGYKTRLFIRESTWKRLFFEKYKVLVHEIHKKKNKIILHSDGCITNLMEFFIELGFDGIQSLEPDAGVDIFNLIEKLAERITFIGNISNSLLTFGKPSDINQYLSKLLHHAQKHNAFLIISPTQQIDAHVKPENVKVMIDTTKQFQPYQ